MRIMWHLRFVTNNIYKLNKKQLSYLLHLLPDLKNLVEKRLIEMTQIKTKNPKQIVLVGYKPSGENPITLKTFKNLDYNGVKCDFKPIKMISREEAEKLGCKTRGITDNYAFFLYNIIKKLN